MQSRLCGRNEKSAVANITRCHGNGGIAVVGRGAYATRLGDTQSVICAEIAARFANVTPVDIGEGEVTSLTRV
jgi:hypothetical protein